MENKNEKQITIAFSEQELQELALSVLTRTSFVTMEYACASNEEYANQKSFLINILTILSNKLQKAHSDFVASNQTEDGSEVS